MTNLIIIKHEYTIYSYAFEMALEWQERFENEKLLTPPPLKWKLFVVLEIKMRF